MPICRTETWLAFYRSGTTLMRAMLDAHPDVRCGEETRVVPRLLQMRSHWKKSQKESMRLEEAGLTDEVLASAISSFILEVVARHGEPAPRLCNKVSSLLTYHCSCLNSWITRTPSHWSLVPTSENSSPTASSCSWLETEGPRFTPLSAEKLQLQVEFEGEHMGKSYKNYNYRVWSEVLSSMSTEVERGHISHERRVQEFGT